MKFNNEVLLTL